MKDLAPLLNPVIVRELASIGAIDTAAQRERRPDYVVLFRSAKTSKQANIEQMNAMIRGSGEKPAERARFRELLLQAQTAMLERVGTTPTMRAMRLVERDIVGQYEAVYDQVGGIITGNPMERLIGVNNGGIRAFAGEHLADQHALAGIRADRFQ